MAQPPISRDDLHAYVDGALAPDRRQAVEAHLAGDREAAAFVAACRTQNDLLHTLYDPVLEEPLPAGLAVPAARAWSPLARLAAAIVLLLSGGLAGWWLRGPGQTEVMHQDLALQAAAAYAVFTPEVRHPVEVGAAEERHLVAWLSKRLQVKLKAPALGASGFHLVGGRLLSATGGPAGLFMYENAAGRRLTLYVRRHGQTVGETAFRYAHQDGIGVFYWIDRELSYALAGEMDKKTLLALSRAIYDQLEK